MEQQMSAECALGIIALSTAMAPPTGMTALPMEAGQASGMIAPREITGTLRSSSIFLRTDATFFFSSLVSGRIASENGTALIGEQQTTAAPSGECDCCMHPKAL